VRSRLYSGIWRTALLAVVSIPAAGKSRSLVTGARPIGDQQVGSRPFLFSFGHPEGDPHLTVRKLTNLFYCRIELDLDSFSSQTVRQCLGNICVFTAQDLFTSLKDGDLAPKPMHHLSKLEINVSCAEHKEAWRNGIQLLDGITRQKGDVRQAREIRNRAGRVPVSMKMRLDKL
jgi:hypothetical protein